MLLFTGILTNTMANRAIFSILGTFRFYFSILLYLVVQEVLTEFLYALCIFIECLLHAEDASVGDTEQGLTHTELISHQGNTRVVTHNS